MPYDYNKILKETQDLLTKSADDNRMKYHVLPVVENAKKLANRYNADSEIVELAAYFHDLTRWEGDKKNHHNSSADYARSFLEKYSFPLEKINLVDKCIRNHRGSMNPNRESIEEKIIATADAMAHIQEPLPFFYTWYGVRGMSINEGATAIKEKLERSWDKIYFDDVKVEMKDLYKNFLNILRIK